MDTTVRKTYIASKKEILIEHIDINGKVVGTGWVGVHYQSPLYNLKSDKVLN